jgi:large subunit ribosomal protein L23
MIKVTNVHTINVPAKKKRRGRHVGYTSARRKAVITLAKGQMLEDYGV